MIGACSVQNQSSWVLMPLLILLESFTTCSVPKIKSIVMVPDTLMDFFEKLYYLLCPKSKNQLSWVLIPWSILLKIFINWSVPKIKSFVLGPDTLINLVGKLHDLLCTKNKNKSSWFLIPWLILLERCTTCSFRKIKINRPGSWCPDEHFWKASWFALSQK